MRLGFLSHVLHRSQQARRSVWPAILAIIMLASGKLIAMPQDDPPRFQGDRVLSVEFGDMSTETFQTDHYLLTDEQSQDILPLVAVHITQKQTNKLPPLGPTTHRFTIKTENKTFEANYNEVFEFVRFGKDWNWLSEADTKQMRKFHEDILKNATKQHRPDKSK